MTTIRRINRSLLLALESEAEAAAAAPADAPASDTPPADTPAATPAEPAALPATENNDGAASVPAEANKGNEITSDDPNGNTEVKADNKADQPGSTSIVAPGAAEPAPKAVTENNDGTPAEEPTVPPVAAAPAPADAPAAGEGETKPATEDGELPPADAPSEPAAAPAAPAAAEPVTAEPAAAAQPEEAPAVSEEDLAVIETDGEDTAKELAGADEVAQANDEISDEVETVEGAQAALESIQEILHVARQNGGLDKNGARLANNFANYAYQTIGVKRPLAMPAMESFDVAGSRATATGIAMEDIKEQIKKIWDMIVKGVQQAGTWIAEFVQKVLSANARMKSRAEKLLQVAEGLEGAPKQTQVGSAALVVAMSVGSGPSKNVASDLAAVNKFASEAASSKTVNTLRDVERELDKEYDRVFSSASKGEDASGDFEGVRKAIVAIVGQGLKANTDGQQLGAPAAPEGTDLFTSPVFLGNASVWAHVPNDVASISKFKSGIAAKDTEAKDGATLVALNGAQIKAVAQEVLNYVKISEEYNAVQESVKSLTAWYVKKLGSAVQVADMTDGIRAYISAIKGARMLIKGIHQPAMQLAAKANNSALDYAAASAKAYNAKVEGDATPKLAAA